MKLFSDQLMVKFDYFIAHKAFSGMPVGAIVSIYTVDPPDQVLLCDGRLILIEDYPDLFASIGTGYGNRENLTVKLKFWKLRRALGLRFEKKVQNPYYRPGYFALPDMTPHDHSIKIEGKTP